MNKKYLLAMLALLVFTIAGCTNKQTPAENQNEAFADIKAEIQSDVDDLERVAQAILIIQKLNDEFDATREKLIASKERMWQLNLDYHGTREAFDQEMAVYVAMPRANQQAVTDLRAQQGADRGRQLAEKYLGGRHARNNANDMDSRRRHGRQRFPV